MVKSWILTIARLWIAALAFLLFVNSSSAQVPTAYLLEVQGAIGPAVADYVVRGIQHAQDAKATVIIIEIDTPGGLSESMRSIDKAILTSSVPVVAFVTPSGARAASAGTFILYASHFAAMSPGTNLGAASPVSIADSKEKEKSTLDSKAMNDATASIRSLAQLRGRNAEWAAEAVTKAHSLSAKEALDKKVINFMADSVPNLLTQLNGRTTEIAGKTITLNTENISINKIQPDWRSRFLSVITNPSVAYLLLLAGFYGLFLEFTNPGVVLPGALGTIALLIGLYALQLLPINYAGLALIFVGLGFMVSEVFVTSHGILGLGGVIAFVMGSVMLIDTDVVGFGIPMQLIVAVTALTVAFVILIFQLALRLRTLPEVTGREEVLASLGVVVAIHGKRYQVRVKGELWQAESSATLRVGQQVAIREMHGLILQVEPITLNKGE